MKFFRMVREFYKFLHEKKFRLYSGSLVFFLLLGIVPFLFVAGEICRILDVNFEQFAEVLSSLAGGEAIRYLIESSNLRRVSSSLVFGAVTLYSSGTVFYYFRRIGEILYDEKRRNSFIIAKITSVVIMFALQIILIISGTASLGIGSIIKFRFVYTLAVGGIFSIFLLFALIVIEGYFCPHKFKIKEIIFGSLFTLIYWLIFSVGFSIYIRYFSNFTKLYGAVSFIIIFLLWLYYLMQGLVAGVALNVYIKNKRKP